MPKDVFVGRDTLVAGVCSAVIHGFHGMKNVYRSLHMKTGRHFSNFCSEGDTNRIIAMENKSSTTTKLKRKYLRAVRKIMLTKIKKMKVKLMLLGTLVNFYL